MCPPPLTRIDPTISFLPTIWRNSRPTQVIQNCALKVGMQGGSERKNQRPYGCSRSMGYLFRPPLLTEGKILWSYETTSMSLDCILKITTNAFGRAWAHFPMSRFWNLWCHLHSLFGRCCFVAQLSSSVDWSRTDDRRIHSALTSAGLEGRFSLNWKLSGVHNVFHFFINSSSTNA